MASTLLLVLLVLWVIGFSASYMFGGFIHLFLLAAIVIVVLRAIDGRHPIWG